jgi:hypothetical protein
MSDWGSDSKVGNLTGMHEALGSIPSLQKKKKKKEKEKERNQLQFK